MPTIETEKGELEAIPGTPPDLLEPPKGDPFAARNKYALEVDEKVKPPFFKLSDTHFAATWLLDERAPEVEPPLEVRKRWAKYQAKHPEADRRKAVAVEFNAVLGSEDNL